MNTALILLLFSSAFLLLLSSLLYMKQRKMPFDRDFSFELTQLVSEGLRAFLKRVLSSLAQIVIYLTVLLFVFTFIFRNYFSWLQIFAFAFGAILMSTCLVISLIFIPKLIPKIIMRSKGYLTDTLSSLFQSTALISFFIMGISLIGLALCYFFLGRINLIGYGLGIMLTAYFFRIGGGVFKTAADISANIASKIDKTIPYFDKRNPATILDITGDCVGKVMGFSADIFSSFILIFIASILFPAVMVNLNLIDAANAVKLEQLPFYIISVAIIVSVISFGFSLYRIKKNHDNFLLEGTYLSLIICSITTYLIINFMQINVNISTIWGKQGYFSLFLPYFIGSIGAILIAFTSEYLTSNKFMPAKQIAKTAEFGEVISLFGGVTIGLKSVGFFMIYLLFILLPSFYAAGFYGIIMAGIGMLSITATILLTNIFNPLAANIHKIASLGDCHENIIKQTAKVCEVGKTTCALGNGFSSLVALIASFSIFVTFILMLQKKIMLSTLLTVDIFLLMGLVIGIGIPFIFSGFLLKGLTNNILAVLAEVKRQFRDIPYLLENKARPDIIKASEYNAMYAMNALVVSTAIMIIVPTTSAFIFNSHGLKILLGITLGTFLTGGTLSFYWANIGDSLNQAKHYIENGYYGGKGTKTFENILVADNFGCSFKDLLSPSLNILIKSIGILAILIAYLIVLV